MINNDIKKKWADTLEYLKQSMSSINYSSWIEPLQLLGLEDTSVVVAGNELFASTNIRLRYSTVIDTAIHQTFGERYNVLIQYPGAQQRRTAVSANMLNSRYTFDTFVVGSSNRFAHAAAVAVAEMPAEAYNPLFLYGGVGLGKTHLMQAIGHKMLADNPDTNLLYMTSEEFTNQVITAIARKTNQELRDRLRNVDVLMVDDIQFIIGKQATQEEFFHNFNQLYSMKKQIVISSDRPPKDILTLEERLRSRFEWGLIADIAKPDYETRMAILARKAEEEHFMVDDDVIAFIAENVVSNIRELEGALTRVNAMAELYGRSMDISLAQEALGSIFQIREPKDITPDGIVDAVCSYYNISRDAIMSSTRSREISDPRQVAMYLCRELTHLSLPRIAQVFRKKDHTTVMHACDKISSAIEEDEKLRQAVQSIKRHINT